MNIKVTKRVGALKEGITYTMDIDAMSIKTERRGALRNNNEDRKLQNAKIGFNPLICLIGNLPIFISMRNGNAGANFKIAECLRNCFNLLDESKIKIGRVISDAAGFNKELMRFLNNRGVKFNIRFPYSKSKLTFSKQLQECSTWRKTEIETSKFFWNCEVADIDYTMHKKYFEPEEAQTYRIVVMRIPTEKTRKLIETNEEQERRDMVKEKMEQLAKKRKLKEKGKPYEDTNWKEINGYYYKFFATNDYEKTSEEIIIEYNKRGNAERKFSFMKRDFGWKRPPFSEMNDNMVFLIATAIANNIFRGISELFKEKIPGLKLSYRIKKFKSLFIIAPCAFINGRFNFFEQDVLYDKLMI
jgi:hypothetical protein